MLGVVLVLFAGGVGCSRSTLRESERPTSRPFLDDAGETVGVGRFDERVEAFITPPAEWRLDKEEADSQRVHLAWVSQTGDTAYGVTYATAPFYLLANRMFHNVALDKVIDAMRDTEGDATLLSNEWDEGRRAMRFEAEAGLYHIRAILTVRGRSVWVVYAGTFVGKEPIEAELDIAKAAREATLVGREAEQ